MSTSQAVTRRQSQGVVMTDDEINRSWRMAEALAKSGIFPDVKSAEQAFAKMLVGLDLGLSATQALMGIHMVEGKPQISSTILAGFVRQSEVYDYDVIEHTAETCSIAFFRPRGDVTDELGTSTFTMADAQAAGLVKDKGGWKKYPKAMLFARAMSQGVRWFCPDLMGGVPVYTEADEFDIRNRLTEGAADRAEPVETFPLPDSVERVIARAEELGHEGLSDRATAEMALKGRSPEVITEWRENAKRELDEFEATLGEAEVVETPATPVQLLAQAERLEAEANDDTTDATQAQTKLDEAAELRAQAQELIEASHIQVEGGKTADAGDPEFVGGEAA